MIQENETRAQLAEYLSDRRSLDEFEDWFVQQSWNMHRDSSADAQRLASQIELVLSEFSDENITEAALRARLQRLASTYIATFAPVRAPGGSVTYTSNSSVQMSPIAMPIAMEFVS